MIIARTGQERGNGDSFRDLGHSEEREGFERQENTRSEIQTLGGWPGLSFLQHAVGKLT